MSGPWTRRDVVVLSVGVVLALAACVTGWVIASGDAAFGSQVGSTTVSVAGLLVAVAVNATWIVRGRRAITERTARLLGEAPQARAAPIVTTGTVLVAGRELRRYHRSDCPLASGRGWPGASRERHERAGREPCGVCRP